MGIRKRKGALNIIFVPSGGGKARTVTVSRRNLWFALGSVAAILALVTFSLVSLGQMGWSALRISQLKRENARLKNEQRKLTKLEQELNRLAALENKLGSMLGFEPKGNESARSRARVGDSRQSPVEPSSGSGGSSVQGLGLEQGNAQASASTHARNLPTLWPVRGEISRDFSYAADGHKGIDIAVANGTPVRAAGDGTVEFAGSDEVFGLMIIINHGSGVSTLYGHNSKLAAARGDDVSKGQIVAYAGTSGKSTAPHLHFEISRYGKQVNPLTFLTDK